MGHSSKQDTPDQGTYRAWTLVGGEKQNAKTFWQKKTMIVSCVTCHEGNGGVI